jgi:DNA-binding ferritin-like protein
MTTVEQLTQVFNDNFVAYYRSHVAHVNIVGRNFFSDHDLLGGIYEELQGQVDVLAELLRSLQAFMPNDIHAVMMDSKIMPDPIEGDSDELLEFVKDDLLQLKGCYEELMVVAEAEGHEEIANYAQERILALAKHVWVFDSTLG